MTQERKEEKETGKKRTEERIIGGETLKIWNYMKKYKGRYLLALVCMLCAIVLDLWAPVLTRKIIDDVIIGGQRSILMSLLLGLLGIGIGRAVFGYIKEFTLDWIGVTIANQMRRDVFDHVQTLSAGYFHKHNTGELMTRIKDDVWKVCAVLGFLGMLAVEAAVHTVFVITCMVRLSPLLTLVPLAIIPVIGFLALRMEKQVGAVYEEISDETAALNTVAEENLAGVRTVKAFAREEFEQKKFRKRNQRYYQLNMKQAHLISRYQPLISFLGKVLLMAVVICGGILVLQEKMTLGTLGAFTEYANNIIWPMEILGWLSNDIGSATASWKKIKTVMSEEPVIREPEHPIVLSKVEGHLAFQKAGLTLEGQEILKDISFDLEPGKTLGIMGITGAGKSMLVNLAKRFYDPTEGRILLDGVDLRELSLGQMRSSMAVVAQDVFLFSDTVNQNVRMGQKDRMEPDTVHWALKHAGASEFVEKLSERSDTLIGERGVGLSGGQKQRISIARAIAKKAPILILDDSTSALDMETERQIQQDLRQLKDTAKIIIGHRISAVREADEILILKDGKIAERGTHESLLARKGQYYRTWQVQYGEEVQPCP